MTFTKSDTPYGMRFTAFCSMMNLLVILLFTAKLVKKKTIWQVFLAKYFVWQQEKLNPFDTYSFRSIKSRC